jgi:hypothetical protein
VAFKIFQKIRNDHLKTEAAIQVDKEDKQPDNIGVITDLITSVTNKLLEGDRTPPWPLTGSDKEVRYGNDDDRPGYFMAAKAPSTIIFLTFNDDGKGVLVNKPDLYNPTSTEVKIDKIKDQRLLSDIVVRLKQIQAIETKDFNTSPRSSWSWQTRL